MSLRVNKNAIKSRARQHKKNLIFTDKIGAHSGNGKLKILNIDYKNLVICGKLNKNNSGEQL